MTSFHHEWEKKLQDSNGTPISLPLQFLKDITCDFSNELEVGRGGYGVVYKGVLPSGKTIAVKKIFGIHLVDDKTFKKEVGALMEIKHQNIVQFIGYCSESSSEAIKQPSGNFIWAEIPKRLLCFEYLCNKSLDKYISVPTDESPVLEWNMRYTIIKGICNGLSFLHEKCLMVHLDLKPENILMDATMVPKIADFGLSRIFGNQQSRIITNNSFGSRGYMAPEYLIQGIISMKADIFGLGVITIEIITGRKDYPYFQLDSPESTATSCQHFKEKVLGSWRYKFESSGKYISMEKCSHQVKECITIALKCVDPVMEKRPTMKNVIQVLNAVDQLIPDSSMILDIHPLELCFFYEPDKLITCSLDITNNTDEKMAFELEKKTSEETCFLSMWPKFGVIDPRTTYTLVLIMDKQRTVPRQRNIDLILHTSTYCKSSSDEYTCIQHFQNAEELGITVHHVTLKCFCALRGVTIFEPIPSSVKIIWMVDCPIDSLQIQSMDANQTEPLIATAVYTGYVYIWNCDTQKCVGSIKIEEAQTTVPSVKFIARKGWLVVGTNDGFIRVYNYKNKMQQMTSFKAGGEVHSLAIHPTESYVLSACGCTGIKLWDWDRGWFGWKCMQIFQEDSHLVHAVAFNPQNHNSFASASLDCTIKVWSLDSPKSKYTLYGHSAYVRSLDFFTRYGQQYLITVSMDNTAKIWDMHKKECAGTLPHNSAVTSVLSHPTLPVLVTGTSHGHVHLWSSINFRLKRILAIGRGSWVTGLACFDESGRVVVAHAWAVSVIEIHDEEEQGGSSGQ